MIKLISNFNLEFNNFCNGDALGARILASLNSYGTNQQFAYFWEQRNDKDELVSLISKIDDCITILCKSIEDINIVDELKEFIKVVGCSSVSLCENLSLKLFDKDKITYKSVMQYNGDKLDDEYKIYKQEIDLFDINKLISMCHKLKMTKESTNNFVTDMSHRIRHGQADVCVIKKDDKFVSCALALAITNSDVLLGGVATYDEYRKRGFARECIYELIKRYGRNGKRNIFIFCKEDKIKFYNKLGFIKISNTAEVNF